MRNRLVEHLPGHDVHIRPLELLTSSPNAVSRWVHGAEDLDGVHHLRLSPGVDVLDLTATLRNQGHLASPNHLLVGQPLYFGGPACPPSPSPAVPYEPGKRCDVAVGVLDTGLTAHPWFAEWYRDEIAETLDGDGDGILDEQAGHGTFVSGLILRQAPGIRLHADRLLDSHGVSDEATLLRALARLRHERVDVLNLSLGGHTFDDRPPLGLERALCAFPAVVACAGNTGSPRPFWPAALPGVLAVGALDGDVKAPFSAYGPWVDACADGVDLASSFVKHATFHGYATWSGTSFATAIVTGAVAALCRRLPPRDAVRQLLEEGRRIPDLGVAVARAR